MDGCNPAFTSWDGSWNPIIYKVLYIPGGCLGFLPSTVPFSKTIYWFNCDLSGVQMQLLTETNLEISPACIPSQTWTELVIPHLKVYKFSRKHTNINLNKTQDAIIKSVDSRCFVWNSLLESFNHLFVISRKKKRNGNPIGTSPCRTLRSHIKEGSNPRRLADMSTSLVSQGWMVNYPPPKNCLVSYGSYIPCFFSGILVKTPNKNGNPVLANQSSRVG